MKLPLLPVLFSVMAALLGCTRPSAGAAGAAGTAGTAGAVGDTRWPTPPAGTLRMEAVAGGEKPLGRFVPATSTSLALKGSRGETVNFQLRLAGGQCYRISLEGLRTGATAARDRAFELRLFAMETIKTANPSFPGAFVGEILDPLVPAAGARVCPSQSTGWYWGEIAIAEDATPGDFSGEIVARAEGAAAAGAPSATPGVAPVVTKVALTLRVWKMTMPAAFALPAYSELTSWFVTLGHHGQWKTGEEVLNGRYAREMLKHRLVPIKSFIAKPPMLGSPDKPRLDLRNQPTRDQSFEAVTLSPRPAWAYFDFPTIPEADIDRPESATYFRAVENTLEETERPGKAFVYLWDEPTPEAMPKVARLARLAKQNAPRLKVLVTTTPQPSLERDVDIFVPVMDWVGEKGRPDLATYAKLQKAGKEFWWYISCMSHGCDALLDSKRPDFVIDRPASSVRAIAWLSSKYGVDGFLYYSVVEGYRKFPERDPWKSLWDFSGNGDGTLFYPGRPGEHGQIEHGPLPSVRLKLWRESSFDAEYLRWMKQSSNPPAWWASALAAIAKSTTEWERDYSAYQRLRDRVGDFLDGRN